VNDDICFLSFRLIWEYLESHLSLPPSLLPSLLSLRYDGSYRNDFHAFSFLHSAWAPVPCAGKIPKPRYRATSCVKVRKGGREGERADLAWCICVFLYQRD